MSEPKTIGQVIAETKAFVRDLAAEAAEVRKHPSIAGLPNTLFAGLDGARMRLENHLRSLEATDVTTAAADAPVNAEAEVSGSHAASDTTAEVAAKPAGKTSA